MTRKPTIADYKMFQVLEDLKKTSKCIDKQVACIIVDKEYNILSVGINTIIECDQRCSDKKNRLCNVVHAEAVAVRNLSEENKKKADKAYVSLFPCATCQEAITPYVNEVVTFGMAHKDWISDKVVVFPHPYYTFDKEVPSPLYNIEAGEAVAGRQLIEADSYIVHNGLKEKPLN